MNKTKAKGIIKKLNQVGTLIGEIREQLRLEGFDNMLSYTYDYIDITRDELKKKYNIPLEWGKGPRAKEWLKSKDNLCFNCKVRGSCCKREGKIGNIPFIEKCTYLDEDNWCTIYETRHTNPNCLTAEQMIEQNLCPEGCAYGTRSS